MRMGRLELSMARREFSFAFGAVRAATFAVQFAHRAHISYASMYIISIMYSVVIIRRWREYERSAVGRECSGRAVPRCGSTARQTIETAIKAHEISTFNDLPKRWRGQRRTSQSGEILRSRARHGKNRFELALNLRAECVELRLA